MPLTATAIDVCARIPRRWLLILSGTAALAWFLIRVIPKPSRAAYPCQRAAFPIASAFVLWTAGAIGGWFVYDRMRHRVRRPWAVAGLAMGACLCFASWSSWMVAGSVAAAPWPLSLMSLPFAGVYAWAPDAANQPKGVARGINPGRVVWAHDPAATRWDGTGTTGWWQDANTDQTRVDAMLASTVRTLTSTASDEAAWSAIFKHYNQRARNLADRGYQNGEIVAVKINLNGSGSGNHSNKTLDASPQTVLAMARQLVHQAHVPPGNIVFFDARRVIYNAILTKVWGEFKDIRFVQEGAPRSDQSENPGYPGTRTGLEAANWKNVLTYSANSYNAAKDIPQQIIDATYVVNLALLKGHSYPGSKTEGGDEGQTGITMCGKNHFGSIRGTSELHWAINTDQGGKANAYSPMVDLAASPQLGAKTILYVLDGLYCGRKHSSHPVHFPNPPFNNTPYPYENPTWPASVLASLDGVALDSVGLDIYHAQSKNNVAGTGDTTTPAGQARILVRDNADGYLHEMAEAANPPSGTDYQQGGQKVQSLGVHEHWTSDTDRRYSRNRDPVNGTGIELLYQPFAVAPVADPACSPGSGTFASPVTVTIASATGGARIHYTTDGSTPTDRSFRYTGPITISSTTTLKAIAVRDDLRPSSVQSATYAIGGGWDSRDVGNVGLTGSLTQAPGVFTISASGADIWNNADAFHFTSQQLTGDGEIIACVTSQTVSDAWCKAGIMLRESLAPGSRHALLAATGSNGVAFQFRATSDGASGHIGGGAQTLPVWLRLVRGGDTITAYRSADGSAWTAIGSQTIAMAPSIQAGLAVTSHNNGVLSTAVFEGVAILPAPWHSADIGAVAARGGAVRDAAGVFTVTGSGADIWGTADGFRMAWQDFAGDGTVTARVTSQTVSNGWCKAGVMLRESTAADARHAMVVVGGGNKVEYQYRTVTGGISAAMGLGGCTLPVWLRLTRSGDQITAYRSGDGAAWTALGVLTLPLEYPVTAGLVVTSHSNGVRSVATMDQVAVTPLTLQVNFQPATSSPVAGYLTDSGATFADRGNGYSHGWSGAVDSTARDRGMNSDKRYDTLIHLQKPVVPDARWEIAVPNGSYRVFAVCGDAANDDSVFKLVAEGTLVVDGTPTTAQRWVTSPGTGVVVEVADGRLTLANGAGAVNNKVCFVHITRIPPPGGVN